METVYIRFEAIENATREKKRNPFRHSLKEAITSILTKFIPKANPDFEHKIDKVQFWLLECERTTGIPQREIGLDDRGWVIMKMPVGNNYGYWTDNNLLLNDFRKHFQVSVISRQEFEKEWTLFDKIIDFTIQPEDFKVLSTGVDGGHKYISTEIMYNGIKRALIIFFADKTEEGKISLTGKPTITGRLFDQGVQQSLILQDSYFR